jgi:hypothetical protein
MCLLGVLDGAPRQLEVVMAWTEKIAQHSWRVRYRRDDGVVESIYGFDDENVARDYADMVDCDRRRGTWLDPSCYRTTVTEWVTRWFPTLDLDTQTLENYSSCNPRRKLHPAQPHPRDTDNIHLNDTGNIGEFAGFFGWAFSIASIC